MLKWKAHFKNQYVLEQFDKEGKERLFREVLDRQEELERFELIGDKKIYSVNLRDGSFYIDDVKLNLITEQELGVPLQNVEYRIVYYKRVQVTMTQSVLGKPKILCYLLGWQTTVDGKCFKRILQIYQDGNIFLQTV
jgi:hypothetical protein